MMSMCNIAIQIPEEVVYDTKMNITETQNFIKQQVALGYYVAQGVSVGYCAQIAGMSKLSDLLSFDLERSSQTTEKGNVKEQGDESARGFCFDELASELVHTFQTTDLK